MASDLELRAKLILEADTRGADQTKAALRGVQAEAAKTQKAAFGTEYTAEQASTSNKAFAAMAALPKGQDRISDGARPGRIPQSVLDTIRGNIAAGGSPKEAQALLLNLNADAATIAAVLGTGKAGAPVPPAVVPGAHPAAATAPRAPGGASLKQAAEDSDKAGKSFHLTGNEAIRFGGSLIGLGIGISAFSLAGRLAHDALAGIVSAGIDAERQARLTTVAFGSEAAGLTAFAQSVREGSGFTKEAVLGAAGAAQSLVSSGKLSQAQLEQLVKVGAEYAQITGQDVGKTTAALADAIAHGSDATGILNGKLSDANVAANYANGAFATTFKTLSDGEQTQVRLAYLFQLGTDNMKAAGDEAASLTGQMRAADTALNEAGVAASKWGLAANAVNLYVESLKELARWSKMGFAAGDPTHDPALAAILAAQAGQQQTQDMEAAYAQARAEMLAQDNGVAPNANQLAARRDALQARAEELLRQKTAERKQAAIVSGIGDQKGAEDYGQPGGPWTVKPPAPAPSIAPNRLPQFQAEGQERLNAFTRGINVAQRESLPLLESIRQANVALLGPKADLLNAEYKINQATDHRLELLDQEKVLRATMANQGQQDALQDAQRQEQLLELGASIRGPGRGAARAALRRFERSQTVPRAELAALQGEGPVIAAQRQARDDAANQQLILLPLQQTAALIQKGADARQHDLDLLNLIREGDRLHAEELVLNFQKEQRAAEDALDALRKLVDFSKPGGSTLPFSDQRNAAFSLPSGATGGGSVVVNVNTQIGAGGDGVDYNLIKQVIAEAGYQAGQEVLAAMILAQRTGLAKSSEAGAR